MKVTCPNCDGSGEVEVDGKALIDFVKHGKKKVGQPPQTPKAKSGKVAEKE